MTGFGNDSYTDDNYNLETEVKSLNSRFLDLSVRLPKELSQHEFTIRDLVKSKIVRGKVSVSINLSSNNLQHDSLSLNENELSKTLNMLNKIGKLSNSKEEISVNQLLLFKDNFLNQEEEKNEFDIDILVQSISRALENLTQMRGQEGAELKKDLESRIINIGNTLAKIEELTKDSTEEYFEKFKEKAKKLYDEYIDDKERFMVELGILSEKHDVTEECIRLHSHIKLFNETIAKSHDVGRKLNFICQEMNREVNTINSKSISSEISHLGITIKEELEKIREQVQNIE
ncbi:MAG: YicC family protein [Ignavibacteria bacterium]|nr:YicC family protein [Ignavibacteria bacterium]